MRGKIKTAISMFLVLTILLCTNCIAFAKEKVTPVVFVPGMGSSSLYLNPNESDEEPAIAFDFNFDTLVGMNNSGLLAEVINILSAEDVDFDKLVSALKDFTSNFQNIACDEDGNSLYNVGVNDYWEDSLANHPDYLKSRTSSEPAMAREICDKVGAKNVYMFNYDWRNDVCDDADNLSKFIDKVKKKTGSDKVTLVSGSLGTSVVSAYLDKYSSKNDIKRSVFVDGALQGVAVTKVFGKDLQINLDDILSYVNVLAECVHIDDVNMSGIAMAVNAVSHGVGNICDYLNVIIDDKDKLNTIYNEVVKPLVGSIPSLWECISYNDFDNAVSQMSKIGFLDKSSGLYKKISNYHAVQGRCKKNIEKFIQNGGEVAVIANYGIPAIPVTSQYKNHTDILIDTKYASIGATVADYGKSLSKTGKYVSPDGVIDASTALLPNNTWFIKDVNHMGFSYGTEASKFVADIVTMDVAPTLASVKSKTGYSQYVIADESQNLRDVGTEDRDDAESTTSTQTKSKTSPLTGNSILFGILSVSGITISALLFFIYEILKKKSKNN